VARLAAAIAVVTLVVPGAAAKEAPTALRVCGASGCLIVGDAEAARSVWSDSRRIAPAPPAPYLRVQFAQGRDSYYPVAPMFYVPAAHALRLRNGLDLAEWRAPAAVTEAALAAAAAELPPFAPPTKVRAEVDRRPARDGSSYLLLFRIAGAPRDDPAGQPPPTRDDVFERHLDDWVAYFGRVRRVWMPVQLRSSAPSPWSDGASDLWVSRRGSLLRRDGEVVAVPPQLAAKIRRGQSLR
jgi:hypothetical protein